MIGLSRKLKGRKVFWTRAEGEGYSAYNKSTPREKLAEAKEADKRFNPTREGRCMVNCLVS